jgi:lysophospholipase L1-like esterase
VVRDTIRALGIALLVLVGLEAGIRVVYALRNAMVEHVVIPYTAAQDFGPIPPWTDGLRILEPDDLLSWRNRRNVTRRYLDVYSPVRHEEDRARLLQRFLPGTPAYLRNNPVWTVSLNSRGFRGGEFETAKPPGIFRIIAVGDSWTFGANVDQAAAYPQRLGSLLEDAIPDRSFEVLNLGVMGYSSHQGLTLLDRTGMALEPDLLLIGFGMNDALVGGWRDKDRTEPARSAAAAARRAASGLETIKLLRYIAARMNHEPWSIGDYMERVAESLGTPEHAWTGGPASETADYDALEPYTRVSPVDYEQNIRAMVRLARHGGARAILLYNSLWDTPYRNALQRIAQTERVPLVDAKALLDLARSAIETELVSRLDLVPASPEPGNDFAGGSAGTAADVATSKPVSDGTPSPPVGAGAPETPRTPGAPGPQGTRGGGAAAPLEVEVVFRVYAGDHRVERAIHIAGTHPSLGDASPNRVAARDDGQGGDQRAGDGVWSHAAHLPPGETLFYVYTSGGEPGRWEGMDVPDLRHLVVPDDVAAGPVYRPIETFGRFYLQADGWHTDALGYEMIAAAVLEAVTAELRRND